jgi:hypothetical protein
MQSQNGSYRQIGDQLYILKPRDYVVSLAHDAVAGSTVVNTITIDPSSDFILTNRNMYDTNDLSLADPGLAGQYENLITVQDSSNGYNWSNDFVPRSSFARDRSHGYDLPDEILIAANTRLVVTIKNPAAGAAVGTTIMTLQGYSLYPVRG